MKIPFFSSPSRAKLLLMDCIQTSDGGYMHTVYHGHDKILAVQFDDIICNPTHIRGLREEPHAFIRWLKDGEQ